VAEEGFRLMTARMRPATAALRGGGDPDGLACAVTAALFLGIGRR
jgi:hypothetical protein